MAISGYDATSQGWQNLSASAPMATSMMQMFAPAISAMTGFDVMPWLNILQNNRQDRPFYAADYGMTMGMRNDFRNWTSDFESTTNLQSLGRSLTAYMLDNKAMAEQALASVGRLGGGTYAFGTGGLSLGDITGGWHAGLGSHNTRLAQMMADAWNMPLDPNLSRGERQMMLAGMMKADPSLLRMYGEARSILGESWEGDWSQLRNQMTEDPSGNLKKLVDSLEKAQRSMETFGEAASNWGRILKTDAVDAMNRLSSLMGGSAFAFSPDALSTMGFNLRHAGGITGRGVDATMAMVTQAGQYLQRIGGPANAAVNVGTSAILQSMGMEGYHVTQEMSDKTMLRFNAEAQTSDSAAIYFGTIQKLAERNAGTGRTFQSIVQEVDNAFNRAGGISMAGAAGILGQNVSFGELNSASRMNFATDARTGPNGFAALSYAGARQQLFSRLSAVGGIRDASGRVLNGAGIDRLSRRLGMDFFDLVNTGFEKQNEILSGLSENDIRDFAAARSSYEQAVQNAQGMGILGAWNDANSNQIAEALSGTNLRDYRIRQRQMNIRTSISRNISGAGVFKSIMDTIRTNPNFTLGELLLSAGSGDATAKDWDVVAGMGLGKEALAQFSRNVATLSGGENASDRQFFSDRVDEFHRRIRNEGDAKTAIEVLRPFGIFYENGRFGVKDIARGDYDKAKEEWEAELEKTGGRRKKIIEAFGEGADKTTMDFAQKMKVAEHMALLKLSEEHVRDKDADSAWQEYIDAAESGNADKIREAAKKVKTIGDGKYQETLVEMQRQLGVTPDQAGLGPILASILKEAVNNFINTFSGGGQGYINVKEVP